MECTGTTPTISQLDNSLSTPTIEELLDKELGSRNEPSKPTLKIQPNASLPASKTPSPLNTIISYEGNVITKCFLHYQMTLLNKQAKNNFHTHGQAIFHVDSGTNVHATNTRSDFIVLYPIKSSTILAVSSTAICEGFGAAIITPRELEPPIIIAPVYYSPTAKLSTLSPATLKTYNGFHDTFTSFMFSPAVKKKNSMKKV